MNDGESLSKKQILHKMQARNARPYGNSGAMRGCFFRNVVGARNARPLYEFVQKIGFAYFLL